VVELAAARSRPAGRVGRQVERCVLGVAVVLLGGAVSLPYFGWAGLQSEGPTIALCAAVGLAISSGGRRIAGVGAVAAGVSVVALVGRLTSKPTSPILAVQFLLREALSRGCLWIALIGAALVLAVGVWRLVAPGDAVRPLARSQVSLHQRWALRDAFGAALLSRAAIWVAGVAAVAALGVHADVSAGLLERPFGSFGNALVAPATAWDAGQYLTIARSGYAAGPFFAPFFPGYPVLIRLFAFSPQAAVIAGIAISLGAFVLAIYLLRRLVALDFGERDARMTLLLVAFFPTSFFFSAVYTESLYLAASVAAIYAARRDAWLWAGVCGAIATASRSNGVLVLVPLLLIYLFGPRSCGTGLDLPLRSRRWADRFYPRFRARPDLGYLLLVPVPLVLYLAYMGAHGDWLAPVHSLKTYWGRSFVPLAGVWRGVSAAWHGVEQLTGATHPPNLVTGALRDVSTPARDSIANLTDLGFFIFAVIGLVLCVRTLPFAYTAYALVSVFLAISEPVPGEPLASLPRYLLVIFPLMLAVARPLAKRRTVALTVLAMSTALMLLFASQFARGLWIA
jgi:mannosyltransferase PIG-V